MKVEACSIGSIARRLITQHLIAQQLVAGSREAVVIALFERSFYLQVGDSLVCIGEGGLQDGPINVRTSIETTAHSWSNLGVHVGQRWTIVGSCLHQVEGRRLCIDVGGARTWRPGRRRRRPEPQQVADGLAFLEELAVERRSDEGLIRLALDGNTAPLNAVERAAFRPIQALRAESACWLRGDPSSMPGELPDLIGLGPGLTPSGDDLIGGFLIGCHHVGQAVLAQALWRRIRPSAEVGTTPISLAHLAAAAEGQGAAALHGLLDAVIENRRGDMVETLDAVARIGHSSGWDAIGGIYLLLSGWLRSDVDKRPAA